MKANIIYTALLLVSTWGIGQDNDAPLQKALERYPMLEICQPAQVQEMILCGTFMVYENRKTMQGKKIPIDVRILPSISPNPDKKAYVMHPGGPGGTTHDFMFYLYGENGPAYKFREDRDVVVMDFRGMGASAVNCEAISSIRPMSEGFVYDEEKIKACLEELKDSVDLTQYNTPNVVEDIEELRSWLSIEKWDFHGNSYGVRVALEYSRRYSNHFNSLILTMSVPPDFNYVNRIDQGVEKQINRLLKLCKTDSICNSYYPDFGSELYEIKKRLKKTPLKFTFEDSTQSTELLITDRIYLEMMGWLFLSGSQDGIIPMVVHEAYKGNFYPLINSVGFPLSMPMHLSAFCPEEINRVVFDEHATDIFFTEGILAKELVEVCSKWPTLYEAKWLDKPLKATVPILLMSGENDQITPVEAGESIASLFPNRSRHLIEPDQGHSFAFSYPCRYDIIHQFIQSGDLESLDTTCLTESHPTVFTYAQNLTHSNFEKYAGTYRSDEPGKKLRLYAKQGMYYMEDEIGDAQLLYKGDDTFGLLECVPCKLIFEVEGETVKKATRAFRETVVFYPE